MEALSSTSIINRYYVLYSNVYLIKSLEQNTALHSVAHLNLTESRSNLADDVLTLLAELLQSVDEARQILDLLILTARLLLEIASIARHLRLVPIYQ